MDILTRLPGSRAEHQHSIAQRVAPPGYTDGTHAGHYASHGAYALRLDLNGAGIAPAVQLSGMGLNQALNSQASPITRALNVRT